MKAAAQLVEFLGYLFATLFLTVLLVGGLGVPWWVSAPAVLWAVWEVRAERVGM